MLSVRRWNSCSASKFVCFTANKNAASNVICQTVYWLHHRTYYSLITGVCVLRVATPQLLLSSYCRGIFVTCGDTTALTIPLLQGYVCYVWRHHSSYYPLIAGVCVLRVETSQHLLSPYCRGMCVTCGNITALTIPLLQGYVCYVWKHHSTYYPLIVGVCVLRVETSQHLLSPYCRGMCVTCFSTL